MPAPSFSSCQVVGRREQFFFEQGLADFNYSRIIHRQDDDGNPADGRLSDQIRPVPAKMAIPLVSARVEQLRELLANRIEPGDVRPLVAVVMQTGKRKIAEHCAGLRAAGR